MLFKTTFKQIVEEIKKARTFFLENNKYDEYPGVRIFLDYEEMRDKKHITYTFKEGILGLRVMTEYEFNP